MKDIEEFVVSRFGEKVWTIQDLLEVLPAELLPASTAYVRQRGGQVANSLGVALRASGRFEQLGRGKRGHFWKAKHPSAMLET